MLWVPLENAVIVTVTGTVLDLRLHGFKQWLCVGIISSVQIL